MLKQGFHDTEVWTVRSQEVENRQSQCSFISISN